MFAIGVPLIIMPAVVLPHCNFLAFHVEIVLTSIIATIEMNRLVRAKSGTNTSPALLSILGTLIIIAGYFMNLHLATWGLIVALYLCAFFVLFANEFVSSFKGEFDKVLHRLSFSMFILTYPWFFSIFFSRLVSLPSPRYSISLFLLIVFFCDSSSWLFGKLLGKGNRGIFLVSPNKSIAGFIGGYLGALFISAVVYYFFDFPNMKLWQVAVLSACTTTAAIAGDLVESMLKRSCNIKDSGWIVFGRGGILDSMDSLLFAVPVFYVVFKYFLHS